MDCSLPGFSVHGIFQARILECVAISFRGSSQPRNRSRVSCIAGRFFTNWGTREALRSNNAKWKTGFWNNISGIPEMYYYFFFFLYWFIRLSAPGLSCSTRLFFYLRCRHVESVVGMWDLIPWLGMNRSLELRAPSLSDWTSSEVPQ